MSHSPAPGSNSSVLKTLSFKKATKEILQLSTPLSAAEEAPPQLSGLPVTPHSVMGDTTASDADGPATLPASAPAPPAPTPSSDRRMTRQTGRSAHTALSSSGSMDSLIGSLMETMAPGASSVDAESTSAPPSTAHSAAAKGKGKAKAPASPEKAPTPGGSGTRAPPKAEAAAAGIRRLDANHDALAAHVNATNAELHEELQSIRAHIVSLVNDIASSNTPAPPPESILPDTLDQLIQSNNNLVLAVKDLQGENQQLHAALRAANSRQTALGAVVDNIHRSIDRHGDTIDPTIPDSPPPPRNKRQRTSSTWSVNVQPSPPTVNTTSSSIMAPPPYMGSGHQLSGNAMVVSSAPVAAVSQAPLGPPAPTVQLHPNSGGSSVSVEVGSVTWGKNITGEFKALMNLLPSLSHVSRNVRAHRHRPGFIKAVFNSNMDAISFVTIWSAGPRPRDYDNVTARLLN